MGKKILTSAFIWVLMVFTIAPAFATPAIPTVTFKDFSYSIGLFEADSILDNTLNLDVSRFLAIGNNGGGETRFDTVTFKILAPIGYYINKISYLEGLETTISGDFGMTFASASAVIAGKSLDLGTHLYKAGADHSYFTLSTNYTVPGGLTSLDMSITNAITAVASVASYAEIFKTDAMVTVNLAEKPGDPTVPIPSAAVLLFSGMIGLIGVRRK